MTARATSVLVACLCSLLAVACGGTHPAPESPLEPSFSTGNIERMVNQPADRGAAVADELLRGCRATEAGPLLRLDCPTFVNFSAVYPASATEALDLAKNNLPGILTLSRRYLVRDGAAPILVQAAHVQRRGQSVQALVMARGLSRRESFLTICMGDEARCSVLGAVLVKSETAIERARRRSALLRLSQLAR